MENNSIVSFASIHKVWCGRRQQITCSGSRSRLETSLVYNTKLKSRKSRQENYCSFSCQRKISSAGVYCSLLCCCVAVVGNTQEKQQQKKEKRTLPSFFFCSLLQTLDLGLVLVGWWRGNVFCCLLHVKRARKFGIENKGENCTKGYDR